MTTISRLSVSLTADPKGFKKGLKQATTQLGTLKTDIKQIGIGVAALGGIGAGVFLNDIIDVNAKFQSLKATLTTLTGSEAGGADAFKTISEFAKTTPFDLDQVVGGFIKLKALGLDPSAEALESYGNTASAMGKSLEQMVEAVADATTGEFERLKEFGIKAKSEGENVSFTFQGITTTVRKNAEEIEGFLLSIGQNQFGGAMAEQMKTLAPSFSNLQDSVQRLQVAVGEAGLNDMIIAATQSMTAFIESVKPEEVVGAVEEIKSAFQSFSEFIDPITDFIGAASGQQELKRIFEEGVVTPGFKDNLSASAREAFEKALDEGRLFGDTRESPTDSDTFQDFIRKIRGEELVQETKSTNEKLDRLIEKTGTAVAG